MLNQIQNHPAWEQHGWNVWPKSQKLILPGRHQLRSHLKSFGSTTFMLLYHHHRLAQWGHSIDLLSCDFLDCQWGSRQNTSRLQQESGNEWSHTALNLCSGMRAYEPKREISCPLLLPPSLIRYWWLEQVLSLQLSQESIHLCYILNS